MGRREELWVLCETPELSTKEILVRREGYQVWCGIWDGLAQKGSSCIFWTMMTLCLMGTIRSLKRLLRTIRKSALYSAALSRSAIVLKSSCSMSGATLMKPLEGHLHADALAR